MHYEKSLQIEQRLSELLELIQSGQYPTPELAERIGVSVPTVSRSIQALREEYDAPGLLVATTNIEDSLDAALFRRFDDVFLIPLPGIEAKAAVLEGKKQVAGKHLIAAIAEQQSKSHTGKREGFAHLNPMNFESLTV